MWEICALDSLAKHSSSLLLYITISDQSSNHYKYLGLDLPSSYVNQSGIENFDSDMSPLTLYTTLRLTFTLPML